MTNNLHERLSRSITVYVTATEHEDVQQYADDHNMTLAGLLVESLSSYTGIEFQTRDPSYISRSQRRRGVSHA